MLIVASPWPRLTSIALVLGNVLLPFLLYVFAHGFFAYKPFLPGTNKFDQWPLGGAPEAQFDKIIFMVVDALRSDFVFGDSSGFTFVQGLIRSGNAIPFTAHATSPTITLPRLKAITTGSTPMFLDLILNFDEAEKSSSLASQDTWLSQLAMKYEGGIVMYGDDTWLKLFPDFFLRSDGTTSFFVSDHTEVDNNVTRHLSDELSRADWNGMILHYLGLDHIGHKTGPRGPRMLPKQREMDTIIRQIYGQIELQEHLVSTLFVLLGDHGMTDGGNHGGSAPAETSPALVFMSPKFSRISTGERSPAPDPPTAYRFYSFVKQLDLVPTVSALLGLPIPLNSLGTVIPQFLAMWPEDSDRISILYANARQLITVLEATYGNGTFFKSFTKDDCKSPASDVDRLRCKWAGLGSIWVTDHVGNAGSVVEELQDVGRSKFVRIVADGRKFLHHAQGLLGQVANRYDVPKLWLAVSVCSFSFLFINGVLFAEIFSTVAAASWVALLETSYGAMMFASSFIEEEQQYWQWLGTGWFAWLLLSAQLRVQTQRWRTLLQFLPIFLALRILRRWVQTGQKFAGSPDIAYTFLPGHRRVMLALVVATFLDTGRRIAVLGLPRTARQISGAFAITTMALAVSFKLFFVKADAPELLEGFEFYLTNFVQASLLHQAQAVFLALGLATVYTVFQARKLRGRRDRIKAASVLHDILTVLLINQSKVNNIPAFLLFYATLEALQLLALSPVEISLTSHIMQHVSYFALGGSNGISSVDLSNSYNGVAGYNAILVGTLTFLGNWAGPIWWSSASILLLLRERSRAQGKSLEVNQLLLTSFTLASLLSIMAACTLLRDHLFIWTVFSPKYLFGMAWGLGQHLVVNLVLCGCLYHVGRQSS